MRMFWSPRSPFVRKALIVAHERGLVERIELVPVSVASATLVPEVMTVSPLNRIPALFDIEGAPGLAVIGSAQICRYLVQTSGGAAAADWRGEAIEAVADGIMEMNILRMVDMFKPAELQSARHLAAYAEKTRAALDWIEARHADLPRDLANGAGAALVAALTHLDVRFAADDWRRDRPQLAAWLAAMETRPSVSATAFA